MEVSYRRDLNRNYMVVENKHVDGSEYPIRMMEQNSIPELLHFQLRKMNGKAYFYYEITSRQPISQVYESNTMKSKDIEQLLTGIRNGIERAHQYLLSTDDILLNPEYIYINVETGQIQLCCVPFLEETENSFLSLAEFILKKLDHGDRRAVDLGYELFGQASQENFSLRETLKLLLREKVETEKRNDNNYEREHGKEKEKEYEKTMTNQKSDFEEENYDFEEYFDDCLEEKPRRKENSGNSRTVIKKKKRWINRMIIVLVIAAVLLLFAGIVYFAKLDLTQTGGLAFLFLAVLWIIYSVVEGRKEKKKKYWLEEEDDEEEDEFVEELLADLYRKEKTGESRDAFYRDDMCGETRCLTAADYGSALRLSSLMKAEYPDIEINRERMIIGKKKEQVDVWLRQDCISRMHAKLEKQNDSYFIVDLNSMNGTFVNGQRLSPNEKRQIRPGDKVNFATLRYVVKEGIL